MNKSSKIYVAGHTGMVGSAFVRKLREKGYQNIIGRTIEELDLTNQQAVVDFFAAEKPEYVFLAAAKVGGIMANNTYRAQFIYENLMIQNNIIHQSYLHGVKKLIFLGSSCIYPGNAPQPLKEEYLLTGELEPTNEPYAIAKIAGIKMCENYARQYGCNFISVMPTNLYGTNDNYNLETSHVLPAILRKMHLGKCLENNDWTALRQDFNKRPIEEITGKAPEEQITNILKKFGIQYSNYEHRTLNLEPERLSLEPGTWNLEPVTVTLWGTGQVFREFMHVDDMASACVKIMQGLNMTSISKDNSSFLIPHSSFINVGVGVDQTIQELALIIKQVVGFRGEVNFDNTHADGTYKKLLDISRFKALGLKPQYTLEKGIEEVYKLYVKTQ